MRIARCITDGAHLLGVALLFAGCTDRGTTGPAREPDLSRAQSFNATVTSTFEAGAEGIDKHEFALTQKVKARRVDGKFRAYISETEPKYNPDATYDPAVTPVLYVPSGELWGNYDETIVDDAGQVIRIVARGLANGSPVDNVWVWVNGKPAVRMTSHWRAAVGGYTLYDQKITGFDGGFVPVMRITSVVDGATTLYTSNSFGAQLASLRGKAADRIECWLTPALAYAEPAGCRKEGLVFAGETFGMGVGTVFLFHVLPVSPWLIGGYFTGWGLWTTAMYDFLKCVGKQRPTPKRPAVPENTIEFGF